MAGKYNDVHIINECVVAGTVTPVPVPVIIFVGEMFEEVINNSGVALSLLAYVAAFFVAGPCGNNTEHNGK